MMERYSGTALVLGVARDELLCTIFHGLDFAGNVSHRRVPSMRATLEPDSWQAIHTLAGAIIVCLLNRIRGKQQTFFARTWPAN